MLAEAADHVVGHRIARGRDHTFKLQIDEPGLFSRCVHVHLRQSKPRAEIQYSLL